MHSARGAGSALALQRVMRPRPGLWPLAPPALRRHACRADAKAEALATRVAALEEAERLRRLRMQTVGTAVSEPACRHAGAWRMLDGRKRSLHAAPHGRAWSTAHGGAWKGCGPVPHQLAACMHTCVYGGGLEVQP